MEGQELRQPEGPEDDVCFPLDQEEGGIVMNLLEELLKPPEPGFLSSNSGSPLNFEVYGSLDQVFYLHSYLLTFKSFETRFMFYSKSTGPVHVKNFCDFATVGSTFREALKDGKFWLDITAATEAEMKALGRTFRIHPLTIEDILTEEIREKCELFKQYYFVCFRAYEQNANSPSYLDPLSVYNVVFKDFIISFHSKPLYHTASVLKRTQQLKDFITFSADWINYALIDDITDSFAPMMRHIEFEVDAIDELVLILKESEQSDMLRRIGHARKKVTLLLRLLSTKPDVIKALSLRCDDRLRASKGPDIKLYLGDIQDHLITMVQNSLHYEKVLARAHSNYLAQISIELTQVSNRTNDVVAKLTAIASVLLPMNVITGLWGMNVRVPGQSTGEPDEPLTDAAAAPTNPLLPQSLHAAMESTGKGLFPPTSPDDFPKKAQFEITALAFLANRAVIDAAKTPAEDQLTQYVEATHIICMTPDEDNLFYLTSHPMPATPLPPSCPLLARYLITLPLTSVPPATFLSGLLGIFKSRVYALASHEFELAY
ncbi:CorA metal ion transporter [Massospora cicadina]|nr:CorA metal ion transporter [Massospora cicadina]